MATKNSPLPILKEIERLSPRVIRILGSNPGKFTLQGTNTYLVGQGSKRILIDTGAGEAAWQSSLKSVLASESASISTALISHWHPDHISGVDDLVSLCPDVKVHKHRPSFRGDSNWSDITPGQKFTSEGATLRAIHCPGHTQDHMGFILEEEDALFTADNVLGHGTAVFEDLQTYLDSLEKMRSSFAGRAYPGHGAVIDDGRARISEYISHRKTREEQILKVLAQKNESREHDELSWTSMDVVKVIYSGFTVDLHIPAEGGVLQVLQKLEEDGKVRRPTDDNLWQLDVKAANL